MAYHVDLTFKQAIEIYNKFGATQRDGEAIVGPELRIVKFTVAETKILQSH